MLRSNTSCEIARSDTDLQKVCSHYEVNLDRLTGMLTSLDRLDRAVRTPGLSDRIPGWFQDAWLLASVDFGCAGAGHLVLAS
jgi:hypothetical protein